MSHNSLLALNALAFAALPSNATDDVFTIRKYEPINCTSLRFEGEREISGGEGYPAPAWVREAKRREKESRASRLVPKAEAKRERRRARNRRSA